MGHEWLVSPFSNGLISRIRLKVIEDAIQNPLAVDIFEWEKLPKSVIVNAIREWIEDEVKPLHRLFKVLRFA
jgi:hypothetical protein